MIWALVSQVLLVGPDIIREDVFSLLSIVLAKMDCCFETMNKKERGMLFMVGNSWTASKKIIAVSVILRQVKILQTRSKEHASILNTVRRLFIDILCIVKSKGLGMGDPKGPYNKAVEIPLIWLEYSFKTVNRS
jgi:hypothetical protein